MKKKIIYFVSLVFLAVPFTYSCAPKDDFTIMQDTYRDYLIEKTDISKILEIGSTTLYNQLGKKEINGVTTLYYPDIDYNDGYDSSTWKVADHIADALKCAVAAAKYHNGAFKKIAIGLTYYWIYNDFRSTNWWWNDLGAGASLTSVGLFIYDDLNEQGKMAYRSRIARTSFYYRPGLLTHTGANLIDYADNTLKSAIINRNPDELNMAIKRIEEEVTYDFVEGFQRDGSFFQHGKQLQTMSNYGRSVMRIGRILHIISKTKYQFSTEKLKIITNYVLRGVASGTFKGYSNYSEVAREYIRDDGYMKSDKYYDLDYYLELPNLPDREQYQAFIDNLKHQRPTFEGVMYFDDAKFVAMNLDGLYISFKGTDETITNSECVNGENRLGLNLSYATNTCVMDEGDEYYRISPIWDYAFIPGTTSINMAELTGSDYQQKTDSKITEVIDAYEDTIFERLLPKPSEGDYLYNCGFDEENQIAHFMIRSCHHDENNFTVTCIATKDGMFLLGAELGYTGTKTKGLFDFDPSLHTTIEQCHYKGSYDLSNDKHTLIHGNAMYKTYDNQEIIVEDAAHSPTKEVNGHWNRNKTPADTDKPESGKVLLAYLNTETSAKYAYSIQPKSYANREFTLIKNFDDEKKVQEVKLPDGKVVIAAYEDVENYQPSKGETISLQKGDFKII